MEPRGWPERTAAYLEGAQALFIEAAEAALAGARPHGSRGRHDRDRFLDRHRNAEPGGSGLPPHGFGHDLMRVPSSASLRGGVSGLSIAARLAEARPGSTVLLVAVELCTLAFRLDEFTKAFSALNAAVLAVRIKAEDEALARRGGVGASSG